MRSLRYLLESKGTNDFMLDPILIIDSEQQTKQAAKMPSPIYNSSGSPIGLPVSTPEGFKLESHAAEQLQSPSAGASNDELLLSSSQPLLASEQAGIIITQRERKMVCLLVCLLVSENALDLSPLDLRSIIQSF
jgi:hypothetical protein